MPLFRRSASKTKPLCEACHASPATATDYSDDESHPYQLCADCYHRLSKRTLRPLEWYRLALKHCPHNFQLHDDFYNDDGTASQPKETVVDADLFPAPTLDQCGSSIDTLWDFTVTRYALREPLFEAWRKHPATSVLGRLSEIYESAANCHVRSTVLELCQHCLKNDGANLVRQAWQGYPESMYFARLASVSAACLPADEGFELCLKAFNAMPLKEQRPRMMYMQKFGSPKMLEWIEQHIQSPITDDWGRLAAASQIGWPRLQKWLETGRPLSLVALDVLLSIFYIDEKGCIKGYRPIEGLPQPEEFAKVLRAYESTDQVPRVANSIHNILEGYSVQAQSSGV